MYNKVKTESEISALRSSGAMLAQILKTVEQKLSPGITGFEIDSIAREELKRLGGVPAFLGYQGFPNSICISVNDAVVHGIPNSTPFKEGDVVGFDFGVIFEGMVTDAARTFVVGDTTAQIQTLIETTRLSLDQAINQVKNGAKIGDLAAAAQAPLEAKGFGIVRDLVGHGVGHQVHEEPEIPNYGTAGIGATLKSGMSIAIEPMATLGDWRVVVDPDGWTIRTRDGSLAAHFEDTVLVTEDSAEILTRI